MKGEVKSNTIVGNFNTQLTSMVRSIKQKISEETQALNDTMDQLDLIHIYMAFHQKRMNFTFILKSTWNTLQERSHPGP